MLDATSDASLAIALSLRSSLRERSTPDRHHFFAFGVHAAPRFFHMAEVVGRWVWIAFEQKQPSDVTRLLAEFGFHWNRARQVWQHPCRTYSAKAASRDPRTTYRSYFPADSTGA